MNTHNICFYGEIRKIIPELSPDTVILLLNKSSARKYLVAFHTLGCSFMMLITLSMLGKTFSRCHFKVFFLISPRKHWVFFANCP